MDSPAAVIDQSMYASAMDSVEKLKLEEDTESRHSSQVQYPRKGNLDKFRYLFYDILQIFHNKKVKSVNKWPINYVGEATCLQISPFCDFKFANYHIRGI